MEGFSVLVEMDPSPQGKSHSCVEVISSVVTNMYDVLHGPSVSARLVDRFPFSFFLFYSEACSTVKFLWVLLEKK